jgi:hypothetical protein
LASGRAGLQGGRLKGGLREGLDKEGLNNEGLNSVLSGALGSVADGLSEDRVHARVKVPNGARVRVLSVVPGGLMGSALNRARIVGRGKSGLHGPSGPPGRVRVRVLRVRSGHFAASRARGAAAGPVPVVNAVLVVSRDDSAGGNFSVDPGTVR